MPENNWTINDSYPLPMAQEFVPPPPPWNFFWYGPPLSMQMTAEPSPPNPPASTRAHFINGGFFGPAE